jgi:hypothetical protein
MDKIIERSIRCLLFVGCCFWNAQPESVVSSRESRSFHSLAGNQFVRQVGQGPHPAFSGPADGEPKGARISI